MNKEKYEKALQNLREEIRSGRARPLAINVSVGQLLASSEDGVEGAQIVGDLVSLLTDGAEHDEGMFSLIHAAESVDDPGYVQGVLSVILEVASSSPRWSSVVLIRVLNSRPTQLELIRQLPNAALPTRRVIRDICERINEVSPQFLSKTAPVMTAAS